MNVLHDDYAEWLIHDDEIASIVLIRHADHGHCEANRDGPQVDFDLSGFVRDRVEQFAQEQRRREFQHEEQHKLAGHFKKCTLECAQQRIQEIVRGDRFVLRVFLCLLRKEKPRESLVDPSDFMRVFEPR